MYELPIFILMIVGIARATDYLSQGDVHQYHAHRTDHLRKARMELQKYFDEWLHQKFKARSEAVSVTPDSPNPAVYPRWLSEEPTQNQAPSRSKNLYPRPSLKDLPKPYGHDLFHLYHLHQQNGDQVSWSQTEPEQHSYSYVYGRQPVPLPCKHRYPPCLETSQPLPSQPVYNNHHAPPVYQQDPPVYSHYQTQPYYNQHYGSQTYDPYKQPISPPNQKPVYNPHHQFQPVNDPYLQVEPAYQENDPSNIFIHNRYPINLKPSTPTRPADLPEYNPAPTRYPSYDYHQHSHKYPPAGPQYMLKPLAEEVSSVLNKPIQHSVTEQQQSVTVSANIFSTTTSTPQQLEENSTTESTTTEEMVTYFAGESAVITSTESDNTTENSSLSTSISPSSGYDLISEIIQAVHEMEAEEATKPSTVLGTTTDLVTSAESSLPTSSLADEMETSATVRPTLLGLIEYQGDPKAAHTGFTQGATGTYIATESTVGVSTSTAHNTFGVSIERAPKFPGITRPEYTTVLAESTERDATTFGQKMSTSAAEMISTTTEVPVFVTKEETGSNYKDTTPLHVVETTSALPTTVVTEVEYQGSETTETFPTTTEVPALATTVKIGNLLYAIFLPFSETTDNPKLTGATTQYENKESTTQTTEVPVYLTTTGGVPIDIARPNSRTTEFQTSTENYGITHLEEQVATTTHPEEEVATTTHPEEEVATTTHPEEEVATTTHPEEEVATTTHPEEEVATTTTPFTEVTTMEVVIDTVQGESTEAYLTDKSTHHQDETSTVPSPRETTSGLVYITAPSAILTDSPSLVTERVITRQSGEDSNPSLKKIRGYGKDIVRREDSWAQRRLAQRKSSSAVKHPISDSSNMISEDLEDTARGHKLPDEDLESCFLKDLIHVVSKELRGGKLSTQDEESLREVFGDMWSRIMDEAYHGNPVKVSPPDQAVAIRALRYFINGTPLARRLGKKSVNHGKGLRIKREAQTSALQPWQEAVLRSILSRQRRLLATEVEDETYRVVLMAIMEQLHAPPPEESDYADEGDVGDTTAVNRNDETDSEYYEDDENEEDVEHAEDEASA